MRAFDPVQLGSIELFCRAAELGSFSAAAKSLGLTPAAVSRSLARLEARLGVRLFVRTTRSIRLTAEGEIYKQECMQALHQIRDAERAISGQQQTARGLLRLSVPTTYAHFRLLPLLPSLRRLYPELELELHISNRNIDFVEDGFDLAIRMGENQDSRLIARRLELASVGVFAAPAYLQERGVPRDLQALTEHDLIQFILPSSGRAIPWIFKDAQGQELDYTFRSGLRVQEDVLGCLSWALAGGGLCQIYHFIAKGALERGELVEVLPEWGGRSRPFSVLYPHNRHLSARVRVFVDFLLQQVQAL